MGALFHLLSTTTTAPPSATMRPPAALRPLLARSYSSRLPQRPPARAPDPLSDPKVVHQPITDDLTFIHRPPPSAPSPLSYTISPASPLLQPKPQNATSSLLPPRLSNKPEPARMSDEAIAEMKRLRKEDPDAWTTAQLARKFGCTRTFVMTKAPLKMSERKKRLRERDEEHAQFRDAWGEKRSLLRAVKQKRREFW
ncbi:mitochondrial ribosomal protein subunit L20-domain-containing protein [Cristinia sonorae]|uniref:Mitochondrial ribosomal protein subunit L20-domain-containing protein n=1 Tax=Cristinia sonorae TaxID=1940300 RepID=A0A8K0UVP0_9AGAR|nr:mitochondrial ribosomal protein subunit L20-domain-containing protein [Cristinia sonorae]